MQINDIVHGFRLVRREEVKETASTAYEFHHEKSGARLLYLQNKDDNKSKVSFVPHYSVSAVFVSWN